MSTHGTVHWTELMTRDVDAAKTYYSKMCGWTFTEMPMPEGMYYLGMLGETPVAGMMAMDAPEFEGVPPHWMSYFAVDDADAAVALTRESGGQIIRDCFDVPGVGRIAIVTDPGGAALGIMTPSENS